MNKKATSGFNIFLILIPLILAALIVAYYTITDQVLKVVTLELAGLLLIILIFVVGYHFFSTANRLNKKLAKVPSITQGESIEKMKEHYHKIYYLYTKLSEHKKKNFYAQVTGIRERIERKMKADKKMELLVQNIGQGSLQEQKENYQQMHELYSRLPEPVRKKYYAHLVHARNLFEKG